MSMGRREIEDSKKIQMEFLEMKSTVSEKLRADYTGRKGRLA